MAAQRLAACPISPDMPPNSVMTQVTSCIASQRSIASNIPQPLTSECTQSPCALAEGLRE